MEKNYIEPEEKNTDAQNSAQAEAAPITEMRDPLDDDKINRGHTNTGLGKGSDQPMPEYTINPNISPDATPQPNGGDPGMAGGEEEMPPYEDLKAQQEKMTPAEERENAEQTAEFLLEMYSELWRRGGNWATQIGEKRMKKMDREAEGILDMQIIYGATTRSVRSVFEEFDEAAHNKIEGLSEKEKNILRPIIASELAKRGAVMTPLMYAGIILLKHAYRQLPVIRKLLDQRNYLVEGVKATYELLKRNGGHYPHTPTSAAPPQPAADPKPQQTQQQPADQMEETTGLNNPIEKTSRAFRNIQRGTREQVMKKAAAVANEGAPKKRKYPKRKPQAAD